VEQTLEHIKDLIYFFKLNEAQLEIDKINRKDLSTEDSLNLEILDFLIPMFEGKHLDTVSTALQLLDKSKQYGITIQKIDAFSALFMALGGFWEISPTETTNEVFHEHLHQVQLFLDEISDKNEILIRKSLADLFRVIGWCFFRIEHDYDKALDYFKKSVNLSQTIDLNMEARSLLSIGHVFVITGELNVALEHFEKALEIWKKLSAPNAIYGFTNIGIVYTYKGQLDLALKMFEEALEYSKNFDQNETWIESRNLSNETNVGEVLVMKGDVESGLGIFKKQLPILRNRDRPTSLNNCLYCLIRLGSNIIPPPQLNAYLEEMELITNKYGNIPISYQRYRIAKGILLKDSDRLQNIVHAQQLFREVAEEPKIWFEYTIQAMMNLGESLLNEFKITQSETVLKEYTELIQRLLTLAKEEKSFWLLVKPYLLKAKLELINFNFKGLSFEEQLDTWNKLLGNNASFYDRIKHANLIEYMKEAKKMTFYT
jgi:tetratricopeptide (TPR) repeat protein